MRPFGIIAAAAVALCAASPAWADDCALSVQNKSNVLMPYDPFDSSDTVIDLELLVKNAGSGTCKATLYVAPTSGQRQLLGGADRVGYRFDGTSTGNGSRPYELTLGAGETNTVSVRVTLPKQQVVPRGLYTADLTVRIEPYGGQAGAPALASLGFTMSAQVAGRVEMSISGAPSTALSASSMAPAAIDLGVMSEGQVGRVFVNVWSNGSVSVSLSSQNGGKMLLDGKPLAPPVRYLTTFDNVPVRFPATVSRTPPPSIVGGSYKLEVKVGSLQGRYAGLYSDVITVEVRQN